MDMLLVRVPWESFKHVSIQGHSFHIQNVHSSSDVVIKLEHLEISR